MATLDRAEKSYDRARYDLIRRNQATLDAVYRIAGQETLDVMSTAADLERDVYAGFMRQTLPPILDKYGNVAAQAALQHYEAARSEWLNVLQERVIANTWDVPKAQVVNGSVTVLEPGQTITVTQPRKEMGLRDTNRQQRTYAEKVTQGRIYQATLPQFNADEMVDPIVSAAMADFVKTGPLAGSNAAANAMTRQLGAYYRDTMLFNAGLDSSVVGVQRIVNPNGCAWCKRLAVGGVGRGKQVVMDFAMHFHVHCKCSIEPLYVGDKPLRPDYYDEIEKQIAAADRGDYDPKGMRSLREDATTNERMRRLVQELRAVERTQAAKTVAREEAQFAKVSAERTISPLAPKDRSGWWWTKEFEQGKTAQELVQAHNKEWGPIITGYLEGLPTDTARAVARTVPLSQIREELPRLAAQETLRDASRLTNPKYDPKVSAYSSNCVRVSSAYELRRRGLDVEANKARLKDGSQSQDLVGLYWVNPQTGRTLRDDFRDRGEKVAGKWSKQSYSAKTTFEKYMDALANDYPPGSRGVIWVEWGSARNSHIFNFEIDDSGVVTLVDAQSNLVGEELADYFQRGTLWKSGRLDDKEPMSGVLQYLKGYGRDD